MLPRAVKITTILKVMMLLSWLPLHAGIYSLPRGTGQWQRKL